MKALFKKSRILALILAFVMVINHVPMDVFATNDNAAVETEDIQDTDGEEASNTDESKDDADAGSEGDGSDEAGDDVDAGSESNASGEAGDNANVGSEGDANSEAGDDADAGSEGDGSDETGDDTSAGNEGDEGGEAGDDASVDTPDDTTETVPVDSDTQKVSRKARTIVNAEDKILRYHGSSVNKGTVKSELESLFGSPGTGKYYTLVKGDDKIGFSGLTTGETCTLTPGKYAVQKGTFSVEQVGDVDVKIYQEVSFSLSDSPVGEVKIGTDSVASGDKKECDYGTDIIFTVNPPEGYNATVTVNGQSLAPTTTGGNEYTISNITTDMSVVVGYIEKDPSTVTVIAANAIVTINGEDVNNKSVNNNSDFKIVITPKKGYAVTGIKAVDSNGTEVVASGDGVTYANQVATVSYLSGTTKTYKVTATVEPVGFAYKTEPYTITYNESVEEKIFNAVIDTENGTPASINLDEVEIEYKSYTKQTSLGSDQWSKIGDTPVLGHSFGEQSTEVIRITYKGNDQYPSFLSQEITVNVTEGRDTLTIPDSIIVTYDVADKAMYNSMKQEISANVEDTLKDELSYKYGYHVINTTINNALKEAALNNPKSVEKVTVSFSGNNEYQPLEKEVTVSFTGVYYPIKVSTNLENEGGITLNGTSYGKNETVNIYYDEAYSFTINPVDGYVVATSDYEGNTIAKNTVRPHDINITYSDKSIVNIISVTGGSAVATIDGAPIPQDGIDIDESNPKTITVTVTPEANSQYYVEGVNVTVNGQVVDIVDSSWKEDVFTATFVADKEKSSYEVTPVIKEAGFITKTDASLTWYDGIQVSNLSKAIYEAVVDTEATNPSIPYDGNSGRLTINYSLGTIGSYKLWVPVGTKAEDVAGIINQIPGIATVLSALGYDINEIASQYFREFGANTVSEEIQIIWDGTGTNSGNDTPNPDIYQSLTTEATLEIVDDRIKTGIELKKDLSVVYGSYETDREIVEALLKEVNDEEQFGVYYEENGEKKFLSADYEITEMLFITKATSLEKQPVGTYDVTVRFKGDETYGTSEVTVPVTITKANATVTMTDDNVVKYENIDKIYEDGFLYTITPHVVFEDEVDRIAFVLGVDAINGELVANIDLSQFVSSDNAIGQVIIDLIKDYIGESKELKLSELTTYLTGLVEELEKAGIEVGIDLTTLTQVTNAIAEAAGTLDVTVKVSADGKSHLPTNHGVYTVGVVTTDTNYNTAYGVTYLIITADFVTIKFLDENGDPTDVQPFTFTYENGVYHELKAKAFDEADVEVVGNMKYYYVGLQSDGTPYASQDAPMHAGTYTVTATFSDDALENVGMATTTMLIYPSDVAEVAVTDKKVVVYDENNEQPVPIKDMITVLPQDTDAKVAVITAGINVETDFSEEGLGALEGVVNIDFPERADEILKNVVPSAYTETGIDKDTLVAKLSEIKAKLEEIGIDGSAMDQVLTAIDELPDNAKLTFFNTYNGTIDENALPKKIGAYLVTAVIFDPDYVPEAGAGVLFITPELIEEELVWTYNDTNGIITQPALDKVDLGAEAAINPDNTAKIKYMFIGLSKDGETSVITADESNVAEVAKGLRNGAYKQVAYIWDGVDAKMVVAEPITREFVVVPQNMHVDFEPDENVDNVRRFTYTGAPIEMPVEVGKWDGSEVKEECLTVTYIGADSQGNEYNSTDAPTNVGVYTVIAVYKEYDQQVANLRAAVPEFSRSLKYAGMNVGIMVIEPADAEVTVDMEDIKCPCGCNEKTCKPDKCKTHVDVFGNIKLDPEDGLELITVITDEEGNVNIILPEEWDVESSYTKNDIPEKVEELTKELEKYNIVLGKETATKAIEAVIKNLESLKSGLDQATQDIIDKIIAELEALEGNNQLDQELLDNVTDKLIEELENIKDNDILKPLKDEIDKVITQLSNLDLTDADADISTVVDELKKVLDKVDDIKSLSINGELNFRCGKYQVAAIAFGPNHKAAVDTDEFKIYPPEAPKENDNKDEDKDEDKSEDKSEDKESKVEFYSPSKPTSASPKTGDSANILGWTTAAIAAAAVLVGLFVKRKCKKTK